MTPLVVTIEDAETGSAEQIAFARSPLRIGRGELNDLRLRKGFVSTYHAVVQFDDAGATYVDLGSTNGSILDGEEVEPHVPRPLGGQTAVEIGSVTLRFARTAGAGAPAAPPPAPPPTAFALNVAALLADLGGAPAPPSLPLEPAPPAPGQGPLPPDPAALAAADAIFDENAIDLDLQVASWRGAWDHLRSALGAALERADGPVRAALAEKLTGRYPDLLREPQWRALAGVPEPAAAPLPSGGPALEPEPAAAPGAALGRDALRLLETFAASYLGEGAHLAGPEEIAGLLQRIAALLEAFGRSFLELRRGYEEFGKEVGVRTLASAELLARARDARQLVAYALDPAADGRLEEIQRGFAEFMVHQVALLRGVVEGGRAMLEELSPEQLSQGVAGVWPLKAAALWRKLEERHQAIAGEDDAISGYLFGREFARAYAAMAGDRGAEPTAQAPTRGGRGRRD